MSYRAGIGCGHTKDPHVYCDGCGTTVWLPTSGALPRWFLNGSAPPHWRTLRMHDGSMRWDLCQKCWQGDGSEVQQ